MLPGEQQIRNCRSLYHWTWVTLTTLTLNSSHIKYNKTLNHWSLGKELVLFSLECRCSLDFFSGNILRKAKVFPMGQAYIMFEGSVALSCACVTIWYFHPAVQLLIWLRRGNVFSMDLVRTVKVTVKVFKKLLIIYSIFFVFEWRSFDQEFGGGGVFRPSVRGPGAGHYILYIASRENN